MNEVLFHAFSLSAAASAALVSAVWQGSLLAALVFVVLRVFPGLSASARSVIWLNVFILLALLQVVPFFIGGAGDASPLLTKHAIYLDARLSLALAGIWAAFSLTRAAQLIAGAVHLRGLRRRAVPLVPAPELAPLLMHNGESARLCLSDEVSRPSVLGFFRPAILLPTDVPGRLTPAELQQVVIHEMEHLRRADDWTNLIQKVVLVLFPLNPALAWVERRLCSERELACDDSVLRASAGRKAYALCLAHLAEVSLLRRGFSLVLGAWERRPELVRRVHRILSEPARSMGRRTTLIATGSLVAGALGCALLLARSPQVVSFTPAALTGQRSAIIAPLDANELGRQLGGKPQFVKAVIPATRLAPGGAQPVRPAVHHRAVRKPTPAPRLADLRTPASQDGTLVVMTCLTDIELPTEILIADYPIPQHGQQGAKQAVPVTVRTTFAVVRTPAGWLVIKI